MKNNSHYERLPIYKAAIDLVVMLDKVVRVFPHAQKYTLGNEMKIISINILKLVVQANI